MNQKAQEIATQISRRRLLQLLGSGVIIGALKSFFPEISQAHHNITYCSSCDCSWCCEIDTAVDCGSALPCYSGSSSVCGACSPYGVCTSFYVECSSVFGCNTCWNTMTGPYRLCAWNCAACPQTHDCWRCQPIDDCCAPPCGPGQDPC